MPWKAEVTISNVAPVTEEDLEAMSVIVRGVIRYDADTQELHLVWRFNGDSALISAAIDRASHTWRAALAETAKVGAVCTEFRVRRVASEEELGLSSKTSLEEE